MNVDRRRLEQSIEELGRIGQTPRGGLTRLALSDEDKHGRDWMVARMRQAGLTVTVDQMGNIFGQRAGTASPRRSTEARRAPAGDQADRRALAAGDDHPVIPQDWPP